MPRDTATLPRKPFLLLGGFLAVALVLNIWTDNGAWTRNTVVGIVVFAVLVRAVRTYRLWLPPFAAWSIAVAGGLHYVGGSLSGLHQIGGPNGLYYAFPWWDNVVHALGSAAVAVAACALLQPILPPRRRILLAFLGVAVASLVGVLVEIYEFAQFVFFGTVDQGYYTNTLVDLYSNLLGAAAAAALYVRRVPHPGHSLSDAPTGPARAAAGGVEDPPRT